MTDVHIKISDEQAAFLRQHLGDDLGEAIAGLVDELIENEEGENGRRTRQ